MLTPLIIPFWVFAIHGEIILSRTRSDVCCHQPLSCFRKVSWDPLWLDSLLTVKCNISGLGWNIMLWPVRCWSGLSSVGNIMWINTRRPRSLVNLARLAHNGTNRITWHWWHSISIYWRVAVPKMLYGLEIVPIEVKNLSHLGQAHRKFARRIQGF